MSYPERKALAARVREAARQRFIKEADAWELAVVSGLELGLKFLHGEETSHWRGSGPMTFPMTQPMQDAASGALDTMADLGDDAEFGYEDGDLPRIEYGRLWFPNSVMVTDLLYRLEEQLPDMAQQVQQPMSAGARLLAKKIRKVVTAHGLAIVRLDYSDHVVPTRAWMDTKR